MDTQRLECLLARYVDEILSEEERREFEQLLLGSAEARRIFWEHARFNALLREFGERNWGARIAAEPPPRGEPWWRRAGALAGAFLASRSGWALATAALALFAARVWFWNKPAPLVHEQTTAAIAVITQTAEVQWADAQNAPSIGSSLAPGWLKLEAGIVQLEFISGARVILEGPAEFQLISPMESFCRTGKLTAEVPLPAHGFKVGSPGATVVDMGTAFGLNVGRSGTAEVQVLRGEVQVHRGQEEPRGLVEGQGVRVTEEGGLEDLGDHPETIYPSSEMLAQRAVLGWPRRRDAWLGATRPFAQDAGLAIHYTFEEASSWSRSLRNGARGAAGQTDGSIVGCRWGEGRWPGKRALEFHGVTDRVRFSLPGEFEALTLAAWVRVDALDLDLNGLMMTEGFERGAIHWQLTKAGAIRLGVNGAHDFDSPVEIPPERFGQWLHLAVVCDRAGGRVAHYVDGQCVFSGPLKMPTPLRIRNAELGSWTPGLREDRRPVRNLAGGMDEFFLFARALSDSEVQQLYAAGSANL